MPSSTAPSWCATAGLPKSPRPIAGAGAVDLEGDYLVPGLVELHTDNMEKHFAPRPGVQWPSVSAVMAHDTQIAAAGITTVFDSPALGDVRGDTDRVQNRARMVEAICAASERRLLRAEHRLHLRCEIDARRCGRGGRRWIDLPLVGLLSINDHTPGQRQFLDPAKLKQYYIGKFAMTEAQFEEFHARSLELHQRNAVKHRHEIVSRAQARALPLASHDDATPSTCRRRCENGMTIAEFPTTREAAEASREAGLAVLVGAPNLVLGGSHSGNIAAIDLLRDGQADILSSDYVPASLMESVFKLPSADVGIALPEAVRRPRSSRRAPSASAIAARSQPTAAPTGAGAQSRARPWCARCGAKANASSDMAGALVYVMGPSGAGKDSVLSRARANAVGRPAGRLRPSLHHPSGRCRRREPCGAEPGRVRPAPRARAVRLPLARPWQRLRHRPGDPRLAHSRADRRGERVARAFPASWAASTRTRCRC